MIQQTTVVAVVVVDRLSQGPLVCCHKGSIIPFLLNPRHVLAKAFLYSVL